MDPQFLKIPRGRDYTLLILLFLMWCHYYAKVFDNVDQDKLWKNLQELGIPDHVTCLLKNLYAGQEAKLELDMEQQTGAKSGKEYAKAVYCHPAYLTYMQSTSYKMPG